MKNKMELNTSVEKYKWQKPHLPNLTGTKSAYHPNKKNNEIKKKYKTWKN
jgi:NADH dehydrogenase